MSFRVPNSSLFPANRSHKLGHFVDGLENNTPKNSKISWKVKAGSYDIFWVSITVAGQPYEQKWKIHCLSQYVSFDLRTSRRDCGPFFMWNKNI